MGDRYHVGICAGFGHPLGQDRLEALRVRGITLLRQDLQTTGGRTPEVEAAVAEGARWERLGGRMLYICSLDTLGAVPEGAWVELHNEPEAMPPLAYASDLVRAWPIVQARGLTLWAGTISNLDKDSLAWLRRVIELAPFLTHVAVHRYTPGKEQNPDRAHAGFSDRRSEVAALRAIVGPRPWMVSEIGYHTAAMPVSRWLPFLKTRLTPYQHAARLGFEVQWWCEQGARAAVIFQEQDAPGDTPDQYGLRFAIRHGQMGPWKTSQTFNR